MTQDNRNIVNGIQIRFYNSKLTYCYSVSWTASDKSSLKCKERFVDCLVSTVSSYLNMHTSLLYSMQKTVFPGSSRMCKYAVFMKEQVTQNIKASAEIPEKHVTSGNFAIP